MNKINNLIDKHNYVAEEHHKLNKEFHRLFDAHNNLVGAHNDLLKDFRCYKQEAHKMIESLVDSIKELDARTLTQDQIIDAVLKQKAGDK